MEKHDSPSNHAPKLNTVCPSSLVSQCKSLRYEHLQHLEGMEEESRELHSDDLYYGGHVCRNVFFSVQ